LTLTVNRCSIRASDGDCPTLFHSLSECLNLLLPFNYDLVLSAEQPRKAPNQTWFDTIKLLVSPLFTIVKTM
jgi:hypothetical protein